MASEQALKFIHLGSDAVMASSGLTAGAIYFEPKTGRIHVATSATAYEPYGGGRISDATFANSKLTIKFNDGTEDISLDFSDVASAQGVNSLLSGLRDDINAIKKNLDSNEEGSLAKKVNTLATSVAGNTSAINTLKGDASTTGSVAKAVSDAKSDIIGDATELDTLGKIEDKIQGMDLAQVGAAGSYIQLVSEEDGKVSATAQAFDTAIIPAGEDATASSTNAPTSKAVADYVTSEIATVNTASAGLKSRIETLEGKHAEGKTVKQEAEAAVAEVVANAPEAFDTLAEIAAWIGSGDVEKTTAAGMLTDINTLKGNENTDGSVAKAVKDASDAILGSSEDASGAQTVAGANKAAAAAATAAAGAKAAADAVLGASTDTADDNTVYGAKKYADSKVDALDVENNISDAVKGVTVTVNEEDGKVQKPVVGVTAATVTYTAKTEEADANLSVTVNSGNVLDSTAIGAIKDYADAIVAAEASRATTSEAGIQNKLGESTAAAGTGSAFARIKALEDAKADGSLMWAEWNA